MTSNPMPANSLTEDLEKYLFSNDFTKEERLKFIYNFIIEDRKRVVEPLLRINGILNIDKCVAETLKNAGIQ